MLNLSAEEPDLAPVLPFIPFDNDKQDWPDPPPLPPPTEALFYTNLECTCRKMCGDGRQSSYTVRAGMFGGETQELADAQARAFACDAAGLACAITDGGIDNSLFGGQQLYLDVVPVCKDQPHEAQIVVSGAWFNQYNYRNYWEVTSGSLPPGLILTTGWRNFQYAVLTGTPTTAGTYGFTVRMTNALGNFIEKAIVFVVQDCSIVEDMKPILPISFEDVLPRTEVTVTRGANTDITFAGAAGQLLAFRATVAQDDTHLLEPYLRATLLAPDGSEVDYVDVGQSGGWSQLSGAIFCDQLPQTGTYTLRLAANVSLPYTNLLCIYEAGTPMPQAGFSAGQTGFIRIVETLEVLNNDDGGFPYGASPDYLPYGAVWTRTSGGKKTAEITLLADRHDLLAPCWYLKLYEADGVSIRWAGRNTTAIKYPWQGVFSRMPGSSGGSDLTAEYHLEYVAP